jgi:hypothetical protein
MGYNISTVALRVAQGDGKGTLSLGHINTEIWTSRLGDGCNVGEFVMLRKRICEIEGRKSRMF